MLCSMATRTDLERKLDAVKREYGSNHGRRIIKELTPSEVGSCN